MDIFMCVKVGLFLTVSAITVIEGTPHVRYGTFLGNLTESHHEVKGEVYAVRQSKIRIRHFAYDGQGPDAYFYIGLNTGSEATPSGNGIRLADENGRTVKLDGYSNADLVLNLPPGTTVGQIMWFSVWCFQAEVDFGSLVFPASISIPSDSQDIGSFTGLAHGVSSATVTILDSRRIRIENLMYDGQGPDTFFWVGIGDMPYSNGTAIPDENGSMERIMDAFTGQTVILTLTKKHSVYDIDYLSLWCKRAEMNFGHIMIPDIIVPPHIDDIEIYFGKKVGDINHYHHEVMGTVYLIDDSHLGIRDFFYDGEGPDAFFWLGNTAFPDATGVIIPDELGMSAKLNPYYNEVIVLKVPPGSFDNAVWFSVWCRRFAANFGNIMFPDRMTAPAPVPIGEFSRLAHELASGTVTILNEKMIEIKDLYYDGLGPAAYFWIGSGPDPDSSGFAIPNEEGSMNKLSSYSGETVILTLPDGYTFFNIGYLSMWCEAANQNFGHVTIPSNILVPPHVEEIEIMPLSNCEQLHERFNVAWEIEDGYMHMEFTGALEENGYMAFGLSGSPSGSRMLDADVYVASYHMTDGAVVEDYFLSQLAQCSNNVGACPDTESNGVDDVMNVEGVQVDGVTTIRFKRAINTTDRLTDKVIPTGGNTYIVWAMGILSADGLVTKHNLRLIENTQLDFGRTEVMNCPEVMSLNPVAPVDPWMVRSINGLNNRVFTARIGPAGPEQYGYAAITEQQSWGIAWYIDGHLIPELTVERGVEYTFIVEGGDDTSNLAKYHPFYITNDGIGGYQKKTDEEKERVEVYAGIDMTSGEPTGIGRYCEYKQGPESGGKTVYTEYIDSLTLDCSDGEPGVLNWTPDKNTPDTVYYQCATHRYLGWKIKVVNEIPTSASQNIKPASFIFTAAYLLLMCVTKFG